MKPSLAKWVVTCGDCGVTSTLFYLDDTPKAYVCGQCETYFTLTHTSEAGEPFFIRRGTIA